MEIADIIRKDADRLFIIDRECYIIYTGTSLEDERPFIRIGNTLALPTEIVPLIENIVITDLVGGNPAFEQFNIDIKSLSENRYIGSRGIVNKFLNYQKTFGLDLTNARIVDVEKDIPYLSREKELSARDAFIGIFYTDGNFRINYNKACILDLKEELTRAFGDNRILSAVSAAAKSSTLYSGAGVVVAGSDPFFYQNRYFTCYHFPKQCALEFASLGVDPAHIGEVVHPSSNFIHLTGLVRWKHAEKGKVTLFTSHQEQSAHLERLFSGATIHRKDFNGFSHRAAAGIALKHYPGSFNIRLTYGKTKPEGEPLSVAYIKGITGIEHAIKDRIDCMLIPFSLFEEANLLLRSSSTPVAIIADNSNGMRKLKDGAFPVIAHGVRYEFEKYGSPENLMREILAALPDYNLAPGATGSDFSSAKDELSQKASSPGSDAGALRRDAVNLASAVRLLCNSTSDRKTLSLLRKVQQEIDTMIDRGAAKWLPAEGFAPSIALYGGNCYEIIRACAPTTAYSGPDAGEIREAARERYESLPDRAEREFFLRVLNDRRRLAELLALYTPGRKEQEIRELREAITERKKRYYSEEVSVSPTDGAAVQALSLKRVAGIAITIASLLLSGFILRQNITSYYDEREQAQQAREARERAEIIQKYSITVTATDVFRYVNEVAAQNGYQPITIKGFKEKNPNWIYPGNVFVLNGDVRITVQNGDTLWAIAEEKLIDRNIRFYRAVEKIREKLSAGGKVSRELAEAEGLAFNERHRALLDELRGGRDASGTAK
jgi:hypothetical protein